ncbi:hypothetical protein HK100_004257, partial [Physocladia obscura]
MLGLRELNALTKTPAVEALKNAALLYLVLKSTNYVIDYLRIKGVSTAASDLLKFVLQKSITFTRAFVPGADRLIAAQVESNVKSLQKKLVGDMPENLKHRSLPAKGLPRSAVLNELVRLKGLDKVDYNAGKVSGAVYHGGEDVNKLITEAFGMYTVANPLHPEIFPGVRQMEAEVISMVLRMYNAPEEAAGSMTSGGTESLLMAIKTYRDMAFQLRGVTEPEMIMPETIHTAVDKGAAYFGVKLIHIPIDSVTGEVDVSKVARAINRNTIMIAGSAPNFPHGIIDPIPELAALAKKHGIPMHVDACLGGFIVPFAEKAGFPLPFHVDFRNEGVTSISCDTHKYGFAPKGSSVIMYRSKQIRNYQYFITTEWPGGVYCSPTIAGSRPGALVAGCWAAMMHFGEAGYVETTREIILAAREIAAGGWHLSILQNPPALHIACTYLTVKSSKLLVRDINEIVEILRKDPSAGNGDVAAIYGTMASVPDRTVIKEVCNGEGSDKQPSQQLDSLQLHQTNEAELMRVALPMAPMPILTMQQMQQMMNMNMIGVDMGLPLGLDVGMGGMGGMGDINMDIGNVSIDGGLGIMLPMQMQPMQINTVFPSHQHSQPLQQPQSASAALSPSASISTPAPARKARRVSATKNKRTKGKAVDDNDFDEHDDAAAAANHGDSDVDREESVATQAYVRNGIRNPRIPIPRVKAIMKEDEDVLMVGLDAATAMGFAA